MESETTPNSQDDTTELGYYTSLGIKLFWDYYANPVIIMTRFGATSSG